MISAAHALPDGTPADGADLASTQGWYVWSNYVLARADTYPALAHLAGFGWSDQAEDLEHELEHLLHACDDPDLCGVAAQVLAALRARPADAVAFMATDGEPAGPDEEPVREEGEPPFPGAVFDRGKHRWVKGSDAAPPGAGRPGTRLPDADKAEIAAGIDRDVAALPEAERPPAGLVAKAKDAALTAAAKVYEWAVRATPAMQRLGSVLAEVFDVPADMAKLAYNPTSAGGQAHAGLANNDFVRTGLANTLGVGVSGHLVASVASRVLVKAAYWVARKVKGRAQEDGGADDGVRAWAELIAAVFASVGQALGAEGQPPDATTVETNLRSLLAGR